MRRMFGSMLRRMEALPLPAGQAQQQGETNLDARGELTVEVSVKWIRNQASHGFLAWAEDLRGRQRLCRWNECEKGGEPGTPGYILWPLGKQDGISALGFEPRVCRLPRHVAREQHAGVWAIWKLR
jgi:hypothetical protein